MAYQRPSVISQQTIQKSFNPNITGNNLNYYSVSDIMESDDEEQQEEVNLVKEKYIADYHHNMVNTSHQSPRPLIIMNAVDISHWSPVLQFIILTIGLILFMCLYGYCQELVIYGWFNRKLSIFSTFLHFLGCSVFAQLHRNITKQLTTSNNIHESSGTYNASTIPSFLRPIFDSFPDLLQLCKFPHLSMGSASPSIALGYYLLLVLTKTLAQGLSNLSMSQINYPAKVLFKSANPIVTILIGLIWFRKQYPTRDYIVVLMLVIGLYIFIMGDTWYVATDNSTMHQVDHVDPSSTSLGIFYVILSMFGSAGVPMIQEYCITMYHASVDDLVYYIYLGSTVISFVLAILSNELVVGIQFLIQNSSWSIWLIFICFCTFGFIGSNFSTMITQQYGALVNGILNTFRKAVTIALSFLLFPERNKLNAIKVAGTLIFFVGLLIRIFYKSSSSFGSSSHTLVADLKKERDEDADQVKAVDETHERNNSYFSFNADQNITTSRKRNSPRKQNFTQVSLLSDAVDIEAVKDKLEIECSFDVVPLIDRPSVCSSNIENNNSAILRDINAPSQLSKSTANGKNTGIIDIKLAKTMIL